MLGWIAELAREVLIGLVNPGLSLDWAFAICLQQPDSFRPPNREGGYYP